MQRNSSMRPVAKSKSGFSMGRLVSVFLVKLLTAKLLAFPLIRWL